MGKSLEEEDYASILIVSLPPSYNGLIEMLTQNADTNKTNITSDMVYKRVCDAYNKCLLRQDENGNGQDELFAVSTCKPKDKKNIECFNCHKKGHIKADCWAKGSSKEGQGPRPRQGSMQENMAAALDNIKNESWATIKVIDKENDTAMAVVVTSAACPDKWIYTVLYDSGMSRHMTPHQDHFVTYHQIDLHPIMAADKGVFYAIGKGDVRIQVPNRQKTMEVVLWDTLHTPHMGLMVVSVGHIANAGYTVSSEGNTCKIKNKSRNIIGNISTGPNGLYKVEHTYMAAEECEQVDMLTLHRQLSHILPNTIQTLIRNNIITRLQLDNTRPSFVCPSCEYAKMTCKVIKKECTVDIVDALGPKSTPTYEVPHLFKQ
jgi:hypothetical protein